MTTIKSFSGEWEFLSNFCWHEGLGGGQVLIAGDALAVGTVEHGFQASKTTSAIEREAILAQETPGQAKRMGRRATMRPDWEQIKVKVMLDLLRQKFAPGTELATRLQATGDVVLIEGNTWGDRFWGVCEGQGENMLGRLLMQIRVELADGWREEKTQ